MISQTSSCRLTAQHCTPSEPRLARMFLFEFLSAIKRRQEQQKQPLLTSAHKSLRAQRACMHASILHCELSYAKLEACQRLRVGLVLIQPQLLMIHRETGSQKVGGQHDLKQADWMLKITLCRQNRRLRLISALLKDGPFLLWSNGACKERNYQIIQYFSVDQTRARESWRFTTSTSSTVTSP